MLKTRLVTAAIGIPVLIWLMVTGEPWLLLTIFTPIVGLCTYEAATMLLPRFEKDFGNDTEKSVLGAPTWICVGSACIIFLSSSAASVEASRGMLLAGVLGTIFIGTLSAPSNDMAIGRTAGMLLCMCYGAFPWLAIWDLYLLGDNARYILFMLTIVWSGDTGAYFGGSRFGKSPLSPRMSPNKTVEGALFGLVGSCVGAAAVNLIYNGEIATWPTVLFCAVVGGIFGQLGDLIESTLKRFSNVKDSGSIIPGHGGFLDRVDGLLFAAPVIWFILYSMKD